MTTLYCGNACKHVMIGKPHIAWFYVAKVTVLHMLYSVVLVRLHIIKVIITSVSLESLTMATAAGASVLPSNRSGKAERKSYAREFKLTVVNHYRDHNNLYQTSYR